MKETLRRVALGLLLAVTLSVQAQWQADTVLGDGWQMRYIEQPDDYAGPVRCTLVRKTVAGTGAQRHPNDNERAVTADNGRAKAVILYIHGYNDYFFQSQEGDRFVDSCYDFYALDLRKYGRSLLPGQRKFQARSLDEYFPDIDSALSVVERESGQPVVMMGHSTGGLVSAYYLKRHPEARVAGLILNSPFLQWNFNAFMRKVAIPVVSFLGGIFPNMKISQGSVSVYAQSLLRRYHGEWDFNTEWKTVKPEKVETSWVRAISKAQKALRNKQDPIDVPILLLHSDHSVHGDSWSEDFQRGDAVLDVGQISELGLDLGTNVTEVTIPDGLHDLALSAPLPRSLFYDAIFSWLHEVLKPEG